MTLLRHVAVAVCLSFAIGSTIASVPLEASLSDLACGADHMLVGRVTSVDMVDEKGAEVRDEDAMTGPGKNNRIRLIVSVDEVVESPSAKVGQKLAVPLDHFMHYSLGQIKSAHREPSEPLLVFLHRDTFQPVIQGRFLWRLDARREALDLRTKCRRKER
jgi:hypothetical protein